jgi:hypothetical protein
MKTKKTILMTIVAMLCTFSTQLVKAQVPIDSTTGQVKYTEVIQVKDASKEKIYKKAKTWIASNFKSSDNMTETDDVNFEKLVGTGTLIVDSLRLPYWGKSYAKRAYINFKFIVFIKDGKCKYGIENFMLYYGDGNSLIESDLIDIKPEMSKWTKGMRADFKKTVYERVDKTIKKLILSFTKTITEDENNW